MSMGSDQSRSSVSLLFSCCALRIILVYFIIHIGGNLIFYHIFTSLYRNFIKASMKLKKSQTFQAIVQKYKVKNNVNFYIQTVFIKNFLYWVLLSFLIKYRCLNVFHKEVYFMRGDAENNALARVKLQWEKAQFWGYTDVSHRKALEYLVFNAEPNAKSSEFPDFIADSGLIEHFKVTSAKERKRKGSEHDEAVAGFERECCEKFKEETEEFLSSEPTPIVNGYTAVIKQHNMDEPEYTYEHFVDSFKRNFEHHLQSFRDYNGDKTCSVFLVECDGGNICVTENGKFKKFYLISEDRDMMEYLRGSSDDLTDLILLTHDSIQVVNLKFLRSKTALTIKKQCFSAGRYLNEQIEFFISL